MRQPAFQLLAFLFLFALMLSVPGANAEEFSDEKIKPYFEGYTAAFEIFDSKTGKVFKFNPADCEKRLSPCSTYKIFNSLVGLETGVVKDENQFFKWDGKVEQRPECNRDQTLQTAVSNSIVWCFKRIAADVGAPRMKKYLHRAHYGNEDITGGITKFWLGDSLKISATEQVEILKQLVNDQLPFSKRSMAIVRGMIRLDITDKGTLYGKTGTDWQNGKNTLGWFVGYVVQPDHVYVFATNLRDGDDPSGKKAREITRKVLTDYNLL